MSGRKKGKEGGRKGWFSGWMAGGGGGKGKLQWSRGDHGWEGQGKGRSEEKHRKDNQYEKRVKIIQKSKQRHTQRMRVRERKQPTNSAAGIAIGRAPVF